jgi:hypothetical protein
LFEEHDDEGGQQVLVLAGGTEVEGVGRPSEGGGVEVWPNRRGHDGLGAVGGQQARGGGEDARELALVGGGHPGQGGARHLVPRRLDDGERFAQITR